MKSKITAIFDLFITMIKIGTFTFGGGYAMISLIQKEFVEKKKWLTNEELMDMITISESTPGPIAINMATFIGYRLFKIFGAMVATIGIAIPSIVIIVVISTFLKNILDYQILKHAFVGINCAVSVLILTAFLSLIKTMHKDFFTIFLFIVTIIITFIILFFEINCSTIFLIIGGGILSLIYYFIVSAIKKKRHSEK